MNLNYIFLAIIFFLGLLIIREDIRFKKIRNKILLVGFLLGIVLFIAGVIGGYISVFYVEKVAINIFLSSMIAFLVWQLGFWPAGDAKFFILLSFLLPLRYYENSYLEFFPSFVLLFNIFVSFLIFAILKTTWFMFMDFLNLIKTKKNIKKILGEYFEKKKKNIIKATANKKELGRLFAVNIFQFSLAAILYFILAKFFIQMQFNLPKAILFFLIFKLVFWCINSNIKKHTLEKIKIENLRVGDSLAQESFFKLNGSQDVIKKMGKIHPDGLEKEQIKILQEYFFGSKIKEVVIQKTIPFSIWIFAGVVLTVIFGGIIKGSF